MEVSGCFNMKCTLFEVDLLEDIMDVVVCSCHSVQLFCCGGGGEFVVVIKVYGAWIKAVESSVWGRFMDCGAYSIIGKFYER